MRENRPIKGSSAEECRSPADLNLASARKRQMRSPSRGGSQNAFLRALRRGLRACTTHQRHCKPSCRMVAFKLPQGQRECGLFPQMAEDEPRRVPFECKVTVTELDGMSHSVEVQAAALLRGCVRRDHRVSAGGLGRGGAHTERAATCGSTSAADPARGVDGGIEQWRRSPSPTEGVRSQAAIGQARRSVVPRREIPLSPPYKLAGFQAGSEGGSQSFELAHGRRRSRLRVTVSGQPPSVGENDRRPHRHHARVVPEECFPTKRVEDGHGDDQQQHRTGGKCFHAAPLSPKV